MASFQTVMWMNWELKLVYNYIESIIIIQVDHEEHVSNGACFELLELVHIATLP